MDFSWGICLDLFTNRCDISTSQCGHVFHARCITKWIQTDGKNKCPVCKKDYTGNIKLFFSKTEIKEEYPKFNEYMAQKLENELKSYRSELEDFKFKTEQEFQTKLQIEKNKMKRELKVEKEELKELWFFFLIYVCS